MLSDEQRRANLRLAMILVTVVVIFGVGFVAKVWILGG